MMYSRTTISTPLLLLLIVATLSDSGESCCELGRADGLLDAAVELFLKAREILAKEAQTAECPSVSRMNCTDYNGPRCSLQKLVDSSEVELTPRERQTPSTTAAPTENPSLELAATEEPTPTSSPPSKVVVHVPPLPLDCMDILNNGTKLSGIYKVWPLSRVLPNSQGFEVYCDMDTDGGGWTVIQRRGDFGRPADFFYKDWEHYKQGFGRLSKDFWLGNDKLYALTSQKVYELRVDLKDWEGESRVASYNQFWVADEGFNYTIHLAGFSGEAGDSLMRYHNGRMFSTFDRDNDDYMIVNCAVRHKGAWWYNRCQHSNLNGLYMRGVNEKSQQSVEWRAWKGDNYSLMETEMKIRPVNNSTSDSRSS